MIVSSAWPESCTASAWARCSSLSGVSSSSRVMPMTPFMGSRISWLMVARNMDLAALAASAAAQRRRSASISGSSCALTRAGRRGRGGAPLASCRTGGFDIARRILDRP